MTQAEKADRDEKIRLGTQGTISGKMDTADFSMALLKVRIGMHDGELLRIDPRFLLWAKTSTLSTARGFTESRTYQDGTTIVLTNSVVTAISH